MVLFDADRDHIRSRSGNKIGEARTNAAKSLRMRPPDLYPPSFSVSKPNYDLSRSCLTTTPRQREEPVTPKIGSPRPDVLSETGSGKMPGYSGHIPGMLVGGVPGKSYSALTRMDKTSVRSNPPWTTCYTESMNDSLGGTAQSMTGTPWPPSTPRTFLSEDERILSTASTPRNYTASEENMLSKKFSVRKGQSFDLLKLHLVAKSHSALSQSARSHNQHSPTFLGFRGRTLSLGGQQPNRGTESWNLCARYLESLRIHPDPFDHAFDAMFSGGHRAEPQIAKVAGNLYEVPAGWLGFGLKVPAWIDENDVWSKWHTVFYPCPAEYLPTVLATGNLVIPGDQLIDGTKCKTVYLAQRDSIEEFHPNTKRFDRCATRVYTTPSITYAKQKFLAMTRNAGFDFEGRKLSIVIQCKQMGGALNVGGYQVCGETIGWTERNSDKAQISKYFQNGQLEYYSLRRSSIIPYRVLFKVEDFESGKEISGEETIIYSKELKWKRVDHPPFGSASIPAISFPYVDFIDPVADKEATFGGLEPPRPHAPYLSFPESTPVRDRIHPSIQPISSPLTVRPATGWLDGFATTPLNEGFGSGKAKNLWFIISEMRRKFGELSIALNSVLRRMDGSGDGKISKKDFTTLLVSLRLVSENQDPVIDEVWKYLNPKGEPRMSVHELDRRFGVVPMSDDILLTLRQKGMKACFQSLDSEGMGYVDRNGLKTVLLQYNMAHLTLPDVFDRLWGMFDIEKVGRIKYAEFLHRIREDPIVQTGYGSPRGTAKVGEKYEPRKAFQSSPSAHEKAKLLCDEGNAFYAQSDYETAEKKYRQALLIDPNHVNSMCGLAWLLKHEKSDILIAKGLMKRAAEVEASNPYVIMHKEHF